MQIFDPIARGNAANIASGSQMMSCPHVEKDINRNEHLNLNLEQNTSLWPACFSQNNVCFSQNKLRG